MSRTLVVVVTLFLSQAGPVLAQTAPARGVGRPLAAAELGLVVSGIPDTGESEGTDVVPNPSVDSRFYSDLRGSVQYQPLSGRLSVGLSAATALRRYSAGGEFMVVGHSAGAGAQWALGRRTVLGGSVAFSYLPSYSIVAGGASAVDVPDDALGLLPASALDYSIANRVAYTTRTSLTASNRMSRRWSTDFSISADGRNFADPLDPDLTSGRVSLLSRFLLNRFATLRLGYSHQLGAYNSASGFNRVNADDIDFGIDYGYGRGRGTSLALTRSTTLTFTTGLSLTGTEGSRSGAEGSVAQSSRNIVATGSVTLAQKLGPLGVAQIGYNRALQLEEGLTAPSVGNSVTLGGNQEITRNLRIALQASFRVNNVGLGAEAQAQGQYIAYSGSARATYSLKRDVHFYGQYLANGHAIEAGVEVLGPVRRQQPVRHSLQFGVTWAVPLLAARSGRN